MSSKNIIKEYETGDNFKLSNYFGIIIIKVEIDEPFNFELFQNGSIFIDQSKP